MIRFIQDDLFNSDAEAYVNAVNTAGVMGKGIALRFKETFPENYEAYRAACKAQQVEVGSMFVTERDGASHPRWIISFPTKAHWRSRSRIEWIADGLTDLKRVIEAKGMRSVALPALGAGHGGLPWADVRKLIVEALEDLPETEIIVHEPLNDPV